jgi:GTP cyclohydrolase II
MNKPTVMRTVCARIPTAAGEFQLCHFTNTSDNKEHLALVFGMVQAGEDVLVRVHSECFTGDVLGSRRCDCGEQLQRAMQMIAEAGRGVIVYLRQEGRGIGLERKLRAYNLQDEGYDTVEANLLLGHQADEREYGVAAAVLADLQVKSIRLLTNNPAKIEHLRQIGVRVSERVPVIPTVHDDNRAYLTTKVQRMSHMFNLPEPSTSDGRFSAAITEQLIDLQSRISRQSEKAGRPFVTITYAQSLDGSIAALPGQPLRLSGDGSMRLTHALRASHDAILVGIGTVLADDPQLTVRLVEGAQPLPVVLDSHLRTPVTARLLSHPRRALIATLQPASAQAAGLQAQGAEVFECPANANGSVDLPVLLVALYKRGVRSVMVEGGARILAAFLSQQLADAVVVTIAARFVGGVSVLAPLDRLAVHKNRDQPDEESFAASLPQLSNLHYTRLDDDLIVWGSPHWKH